MYYDGDILNFHLWCLVVVCAYSFKAALSRCFQPKDGVGTPWPCLLPATKLGKVIFSVACVKNSVHGGVCPIVCRIHPPGSRHPSLDQRQAPPPESRHHPPPGADPPAQHAGRDTGNKRAVRILLECNLVLEVRLDFDFYNTNFASHIFVQM